MWKKVDAWMIFYCMAEAFNQTKIAKASLMSHLHCSCNPKTRSCFHENTCSLPPLFSFRGSWSPTSTFRIPPTYAVCIAHVRSHKRVVADVIIAQTCLIEVFRVSAKLCASPRSPAVSLLLYDLSMNKKTRAKVRHTSELSIHSVLSTWY